MSDPLSDQRFRARNPLSMVLMLVACWMMLAAFLLLATGAVAEPLESPGGHDVGYGRPLGESASDSNRAATIELRQARSVVNGRFVLDDRSTDQERALEASILTSRSGGGVVTGDQVNLVVEGGAATVQIADPNGETGPTDSSSSGAGSLPDH
jgi:hypothetical protein